MKTTIKTNTINHQTASVFGACAVKHLQTDSSHDFFIEGGLEIWASREICDAAVSVADLVNIEKAMQIWKITIFNR